MDIQFFGANCVVITTKQARIVLDDNLAELGAKSVTRDGDIAIFTGPHADPAAAKLVFDQPGEYEVAGISIAGIPARAHLDAEGQRATMYKIMADDLEVLVTGHISADLNDAQLETIGMIDLMIVPVGGNGYTLDGMDALRLIKKIEPKLVIPVHYADPSLHYPVPQRSLEEAIKDLAMEPKETIAKLRLKDGEFADTTQLVVLQKA